MNTKLGNFQVTTVEFVPVLDTNEVVAGDVMCATLPIALAGQAPVTGRFRIEIVGLSILDKDDKGGLLDVVFLKSDVQLGTVNAAISITDANAENIIGIVPITSYYDLINSQRAQPGFDPIFTELASQYLYVALVARATNTYTASGIKGWVSVRIHNLGQS